MKRVLIFILAFLLMSFLWLIFEVPYGIRCWAQDRWNFIVSLWRATGEES
jgi:hypothetical protein